MYDIVIIGGGPAGLSAAVYARRGGLKAAVLERDTIGAGQISESPRVDNYLGFYGESGAELGEKFRSHAEQLGAKFIEGEAEKIIPIPGSAGYSVRMPEGISLETKTVIYAAGCYRRRLGIEGEDVFYGRGVSCCAVCDGAFYGNKPVAVIGAGDTAFTDAVYLSDIASRVYIISRRDVFRAGRSIVASAGKKENIEIITNAVPIRIFGEKLVSGLTVSIGGTEKNIAVSGIFTAIGSVPNTDILSGIAKLDGNGYVIAGEDGVTSAEGIYAAGDVRTKPLRQLVTAAADGANCALSAEKYIREKGAF